RRTRAHPRDQQRPVPPAGPRPRAQKPDRAVDDGTGSASPRASHQESPANQVTFQTDEQGGRSADATPCAREEAMAREFKGKISLDVRDSKPDWGPFLQPQAPEGAPNVLMIVWDDVGYGA